MTEFLYERDMPEEIKTMSKEQLEQELQMLEKMPKLSKQTFDFTKKDNSKMQNDRNGLWS